jgi:pimeloyl-ACP methyl ester carboxylesterase
MADRMIIIIVLLSGWLYSPMALAAETKGIAEASHRTETVVLLHGIARTAGSLGSLESSLQDAGYNTVAITYPSTDYSIDKITDYLHKNHLTEDFWSEQDKVHFVSHSMGGLVTRAYLDKYRQDKIGRVVMLAPPHGGSEVADLLSGFPLYDWYYGPAGAELKTGHRQKDKTKPYYDVGIIAGTREWPYIVAAFLVPGKGDGRVSVKNTKWPSAKDHIALPATHTFIMNKKTVHDHVLEFLENGKFTTPELAPAKP